MKNIKEIHTFGTSFTAGGGYLWDLPDETINSHPNLKKILNIQKKHLKQCFIILGQANCKNYLAIM